MLQKKGFVWELRKNKVLFLMIVPTIVYFIVFAYIPMSGTVLAFKNFNYSLGIFGSPWNGLENFRFFFISGTGARITRNTIFFNFLLMITSQCAAIFIAIIMNQLKSMIFKRSFQFLIFLPYFISWVVVGVFIYNTLNYEIGVLNSLLRNLGLQPVNVYGNPGVWKYIITFFNMWKWMGYLSIIYTAAILGIDVECYQAADIDGANVFQKIFKITMPSIMPTVMIMFLLNIGRILRGDFQMFYQIVGNNGQLFNATDIIDTFVFRSLLYSQDIGMTAAAGLYQSVLCFIIIVSVNQIVRKVDRDYSLF